MEGEGFKGRGGVEGVQGVVGTVSLWWFHYIRSLISFCALLFLYLASRFILIQCPNYIPL